MGTTELIYLYYFLLGNLKKKVLKKETDRIFLFWYTIIEEKSFIQLVLPKFASHDQSEIFYCRDKNVAQK